MSLPDSASRASAETAGTVPAPQPDERTPLVTVVIPCFNAAATIARAVASVTAQRHARYEIIAVDDASRDATPAIVRDYEEKGVLKAILLPQNAGPSAARNAAIAVARGEFVAFLDADDEWQPDKLTRQVAMLAANPRMSMVGCGLAVRLPDGSAHVEERHWAPPTGQQAWKALLGHGYYVPTAIVTRTALVRELGGFDEHLRSGEDQDLCIRLALRGEVGVIDEPLATKHQQAEGLTLRFVRREWTTVLPMIERHCAALGDRLTPGERSQILGRRYSQIGRNAFPAAPLRGLGLILRAIRLGYRPLENMLFVATAPVRIGGCLWRRSRLS